MITKIQTPNQWIVFGEVGTSSKTIWAVLTNAVISYVGDWNFDAPHDMDDFSRCYKLIQLFPEWRQRLPEVARIFPIWVPFVREWDKLCELCREWTLARAIYEETRYKHPRKAKQAWHEIWDSTFTFVQQLRFEGMRLDGWVEDSPGCWHKEKKTTMRLNENLTCQT